VADFGITHDADGQADVEAVGHDLGAGPLGGEAAGDREVRQFDGVELVVLGVVVFAPTVADHQEYGFHKWIGGRDRVIWGREAKRKGGKEGRRYRRSRVGLGLGPGLGPGKGRDSFRDRDRVRGRKRQVKG
jgi:hypothetical protein